MCPIAERLNQEKSECKIKYREEGMASGITWAKTAPYRELKRIITKQDGIVDFYHQYGAIPHDEIEISDSIHNYISDVFEADPLLDNYVDGAGLVLGSCLSEEATEWFLGWLEGIEQVWNEYAVTL